MSFRGLNIRSEPRHPGASTTQFERLARILRQERPAHIVVQPQGYTPTVADEPPPASTTPTPSATTPPVAAHPELAAQSPSQQFLHWLRDGLHQKRLAINDATALLHTMDGTLFLVNPGIFRRYLQEHPESASNAKPEGVADWQWLQKQFKRLGQHRKRADDLNLWTCEVCGPRPGKRLHRYLLLDPKAVMPSATFDNPYLRLIQGPIPPARTKPQQD